MEDGFPLLTTKKLHLKSIIYELLWFLKGETNVKYLQENGVRIWNEWADENGELGPIYGYQWRSWPDYRGGHIDQISEAIETIRHNPDSRRILVSAWNVGALADMGHHAHIFRDTLFVGSSPFHSRQCGSVYLRIPQLSYLCRPHLFTYQQKPDDRYRSVGYRPLLTPVGYYPDDAQFFGVCLAGFADRSRRSTVVRIEKRETLTEAI